MKDAFDALRRHWEVVSALLHAGADPSHGNENQDQPLHLAALANSLDVLRVLMATGTAWQSKVTIEAADAQGYAALHYAAGEGHERESPPKGPFYSPAYSAAGSSH